MIGKTLGHYSVLENLGQAGMGDIYKARDTHLERAAARSSAFQFRGKAPEVREIGQRFSVDAVLEGSVPRAGERLRATAQLVKTADGFQLWSERHDWVIWDMFDIQDEISQAIVDKLEVRLAGSQRVNYERGFQ